MLAILCLVPTSEAITLEPGVTYDCRNTEFNLSYTHTVSSVQLYNEQIQFNDSAFSITSSAGTSDVTIHPYTSSLLNFTIIHSTSASNTLTISGLDASSGYNVYQNGVFEDTGTSNGAGIMTYITAEYTGEKDYLFLKTTSSLVVGVTEPSDSASIEYADNLVINYTATATSPSTVQNISLYDNRTGDWAFRSINTTTGDGTKFLDAYSGSILSTIHWGVYACDLSTCSWSSNATYTVTDTTAPTVNIILNASTLEADNNDCIHGFYNVTDYFGVSTVARVMDSGGTVYATNTSTNGTLTFCYNESGGLDTYQYNVTATDDNGNVQSSNVSFVVQDTIAPRITLSLNVSSIEAGRDCVLIDGASVETLSDTYWLNVSNSTGDLVASNDTGSGNIIYCYQSETGIGLYAVNLTAVDSSGNVNSTSDTFNIVHTLNPVAYQVSPPDSTTYSLGQTSTNLICNSTTYVPIANFTFNFNQTGSVYNSTIAGGNQSSLYVTWGSDAYSTYNWSCMATDIYGNNSATTGLWTFTYTNATTALNCSWMSGAENGSLYSFSHTSDGVNVTLEANNLRRYSQIYCTAYPLGGDCIYGAGNVSSIVFPVSNVSMDACNFTVYTPKTLTGNLTIPVYYDPAYNDTNLNVNWTNVQYIRRYYFNESSGLIN